MPNLPLFVHSDIDDMTDLTPNALRVYMHLARRADADGVAWPSYQAIGDHCFKSVSDNPVTRKSFARRAIDELIEAELLSKQSREREDGGQTSNGYSLSTVDSFTPPMPIGTPLPIKQEPCLIDTPHAYKAPEDTPIEDTPIKKDDDDNARKAAHGSVFKAWMDNIPGTMTPILGDKLHDLIDECGPPAVIHGIVASVEAGARNFSYIAACARNHASGKEPPTKASPSTNGNSYHVELPARDAAEFNPPIHPVQHLPYKPPPMSTSDPWAVLVAELSITLAGGFVPTLQESQLEAVGEIDGEDGRSMPCYRVIVPSARVATLEHFKRQAGAEIQKRLSAILRKRVFVEIVAAEQEQVPA